MDLSTVEQCVSDAVEEAGNVIGRYVLSDPHFGAVVLEPMRPVIREVALMVGDQFNAAAVMADVTQPIALEP